MLRCRVMRRMIAMADKRRACVRLASRLTGGGGAHPVGLLAVRAAGTTAALVTLASAARERV